MKMTRRTFIRTGSIALGGSLFAVSCKIDAPGYYFFSEEEAKTLIALCEQIIPADHDPGATDAGVIHYIDNQMVKYFRKHQEGYRRNLSLVNECSTQLHGMPFYAINSDQQTDFMRHMQNSKLPPDLWKPEGQKVFFDLVLEHTMQGFYGAARHGGNKNYMSYKMMGLEYPLVIGQNRYMDL